jgi:hypothetical protein
MSSNYYAWKDLDWIVVLIIIVAPLAMLPVFLIFESMFNEVNQRLSPERRFPRNTMGRWWSIMRTHRELLPNSRARKTLCYFLALPIVLFVALVLRALYISATF